MAQFSQADTVVGKVLFEDDEQVTLEFIKDPDKKIQLDPEGKDRFFVMLFVQVKDGDITFEKGWEL